MCILIGACKFVYIQMHVRLHVHSYMCSNMYVLWCGHIAYMLDVSYAVVSNTCERILLVFIVACMYEWTIIFKYICTFVYAQN